MQEKITSGQPYVIRFKNDPEGMITINDQVKGEVTFDSSLIDDKILIKEDGYPTYHLANIVDDHLMQITHVIRGDEWLPSLPLHISLYKAFEWETPQFAHLPLILKPTGKGNEQKRWRIR